MKNKRHYFLVIFMLLMSACGSDLMNPVPLIKINPAFSSSGFTDATLISQNDTDVYTAVYSRVNGISRDLSMNLTVDEAALNSYNDENGTSYKLLPPDYYTMPENTKFDIKSKNANFDVTFNSKKIYEMAGSVNGASNYVLPIKAVTDQTTGVDINDSKNTVLLHVNMSPATVSTMMPSSVDSLYFAKNSESTETISLSGTMNFSGIDPQAISVKVDNEAPLLANNSSYMLLPEANYSFGSSTLDENGNLVISGTINATGLSENQLYLLPCRLFSSSPDYVINQEESVYFSVRVSDVKVSVTGASQTKPIPAYTSVATLQGTVNVTSNSVITNDLTIDFKYDPSLIADFNSNNGQNFETMPDGAVSVTNGKISAGTKSTDIPYSIDLSGLKLGDGVHYLVPLVIQKNDLELGSVSGPEVLYLDVTKTLVGDYNLNVIDNQRPRNIGSTIWDVSKCQRASEDGWAAVMAKSQYGFAGDGDWYPVLFTVTDEDMPEMDNCKKIDIHTFLELLDTDGGTNKVTGNKSYFNTVTGEIYIDCYVYESYFDATYKETYSFTRK